MHLISMVTKQFTPDRNSKPINAVLFLAEISLLKRAGELDNALSKLIDSGNSESQSGNHENAALFFYEAGKLLLHLNTGESRQRAAELLGNGAQECEEAAKKVMNDKRENAIDAPHNAARLYDRAARFYSMTALHSDIIESARCFHLAASFYKTAALLSETSDSPKERTEALWLLCAEADLSYCAVLMSKGTVTRDESFSIGRSMEAASNAYLEVGYKKKALLCLAKAVDVIKSCRPGAADSGYLMSLLRRSEEMNLREGDIVAAAVSVLYQHDCGRI